MGVLSTVKQSVFQVANFNQYDGEPLFHAS